jgi:hypothetical protein
VILKTPIAPEISSLILANEAHQELKTRSCELLRMLNKIIDQEPMSNDILTEFWILDKKDRDALKIAIGKTFEALLK